MSSADNGCDSRHCMIQYGDREWWKLNQNLKEKRRKRRTEKNRYCLSNYLTCTSLCSVLFVFDTITVYSHRLFLHPLLSKSTTLALVSQHDIQPITASISYLVTKLLLFYSIYLTLALLTVILQLFFVIIKQLYALSERWLFIIELFICKRRRL